MGALDGFGTARNPGYNLIAYYYPEWYPDNEGNSWRPSPWEVLRTDYKDRIPLTGEYDCRKQDVVLKQCQLAFKAGISAFAVCWYGNNDMTGSEVNGTFNDGMLEAFKSLPNFGFKFCLMIDNVSRSIWPTTKTKWQNAISAFKQNFDDERYLKIDNKPVVVIFSPNTLRNQAYSWGGYPDATTAHADAITTLKTACNNNVFVIGCTDPQNFWVGNGKEFEDCGYSGTTAYAWVRKFEEGTPAWNWSIAPSYMASYEDALNTHSLSWDWVLSTSATNIPFMPPLICGTDRQPWSSVPTGIVANESQWETMLDNLKSSLDAYPVSTRKTAFIYAWNELSEGGYLEPTHRYGESLLGAIRERFYNGQIASRDLAQRSVSSRTVVIRSTYEHIPIV